MMAAPRKRTPELHSRQVPSLINELVWVLAAAVLGFATTGFFSGLLELRRDWFVAIYALLFESLLFGYIR